MSADSLQERLSAVESDEFYSPKPAGYVPGRTKFVVVTGSVISGIGKGTITSTLAKVLKNRGLNVEPIKLEAYLNVDAGTLNPFRHGEVFVLDDGTETDLDLGSYERMVDKNLSRDNFVTSGRIYHQILEKERRGQYLGRDVQFIPHVTGEIKRIVRELSVKSQADVIVIEIGGTVGDYENMFALEALRELHYEEGHQNVCFVNITYVVEPHVLGEQKTKAAQLGVKQLIQMGIQPDIIVCRSSNPLNASAREKISLYLNVPVSQVFGVHDVKNIYQLPLALHENGFETAVLKHFGLWESVSHKDGKELRAWSTKCSTSESVAPVRVGIVGKYLGNNDTYMSILKALEHCSFETKVPFEVHWVNSTDLEKPGASAAKALAHCDGVIVPGGFGGRGIEGKIKAVEFAREKNVPYLGLCYGFQLALIEFARNVLKLPDAHSTEIKPNCKHPVVDLLPEQRELGELGATMRLGGHDVEIKPHSLAHRIHGADLIRRRFRHRFECNPSYIRKFEEGGIVFSGKAPNRQIMQVLELPKHAFFMASQFHPELTSRPLSPDPMFLALYKAMIQKRGKKEGRSHAKPALKKGRAKK